MTTPEEKARLNIDRMLSESGWVIQNMKELNPDASLGVAVREYPTDSGEVDYALFINRQPVGIIEAKKEGVPLTKTEEQSERYATGELKYTIKQGSLPFVYESTGIETHFTDNRDPAPRAREVFSFHQPATVQEWLSQPTTLRKRLLSIPKLDTTGLRKCQERAIVNLEKSFEANRPRALVQMATGSGKTYTAITAGYRLLKFAKAKRILFLVDTKNLGEQAEQEFQAYTPNDDKRKFTELYGVQRLSSNFIDKSSQVCISTIQRMYSILKGENLDESVEQESPYEIRWQNENPKDVCYNKQYPPEFFDIIIVDECHRSIYNLWKQVLDYFDAFLIGLTATPDYRTFGFFKENIVSEYTHEDAVADGVNVPYDVFTIETKITKQGSRIAAKEFVDFRSRLTRKKRWAQLDEEIEYGAQDLDKSVVNPSQIRQIIRKFKEKLPTEIFPGRKEVPKTLIFAKTDSHADDIIQIVREEFGEGNDFCRKVTYKAEEDPKSTLQAFRTAYNPRIAVTVDMIATGTDVKPIEVLLFMRDVRSRNYFEQMKGRGTRTFKADDLKKVTPSASGNKTHFVIVDAVGVCKSVKTDSRALERKRNVPIKDLMLNVAMGNRDEDTVTSLANRLARLNTQITDKERQKFTELTGGKGITDIIHELFDAFNPDKNMERARKKHRLASSVEPAENQIAEAQIEMAFEASKVFEDPKLRDFVENARKAHEQIIDIVNLDKVISSGFDGQVKERAAKTVKEFKTYIAENRDVITALTIFYSQPYRRRELTYQMISDLCETIKQNKPRLAPFSVWHAYEQLEKVTGQQPENELVALVSLIRRVLEIDAALTPYDSVVNRNFQAWVMDLHKGNAPKFTEEQMQWLRMIKDHIATSMHMARDDFDFSPFAELGGLGKAWLVFGERLDKILDELNEKLAA
jgi:type I restriction enzyme, R subunit